MLLFTDHIRKSMTDGKLTGSIFIDLSKVRYTEPCTDRGKPVINWSQRSRLQTFPELHF